MRVMVTGATGFLGQSLVKRLIKDKHQVTAIGRNAQKGQLLARIGANFVAIDLESKTAFEQLSKLGTHHGVIHAAALSSPWGKYQTFFNANVNVTQTMIKAARHLKSSRIIYISTPSVYFSWQDQIDIDETFQLPKPINAYAATKRLAELEILQAQDLSPIILRPRALYGKGDTVLLPRLVRALQKDALPLLRGGQALTNLTYIDDCVRAICLALHATDIKDARIFNIAGSEQIPIRRIVERISQKTRVPLKWKEVPVSLARFAVKAMEIKARLTPLQPEPPITSYGLGVFSYSQTLNCALARINLGFIPKTSFEQGLNHVFGANKP